MAPQQVAASYTADATRENFFSHVAGVGRDDPDPLLEVRKAEEGSISMMTALVLICSLAKTPLAMDCGSGNAIDVLRVPGEYSSMVTCFTRAQAFVGESRYELAADRYIKVVCGKPTPPALRA